MGVVTLGLVERKFDLEEIVYILKEKTEASNVNFLTPKGHPELKMGWIDFTIGTDNYIMGVSEFSNAEQLYKNALRISLNRSEIAQEVIQKIVSEFGGYYIADDCAADDEWKPVEKQSTIDWTEYLKEKKRSYLEKKKEILTKDIEEKIKQLRETQDELFEVTKALDEIE